MAMNSLMEKIKTKFNGKKITRKKIQRLGSNSAKICELIKKTGKIEEYLTKENELGLDSACICMLIEETGELEKYLTEEYIRRWSLSSTKILALIKKTGKIEECLKNIDLRKIRLSPMEICELIEETGKLEEYLTRDNMQKWGIDSGDVSELIAETGDIGKYLTTKNIREWGLSSRDICSLIKKAVNMENKEIENKNGENAEIKTVGIEKYLTRKNIEEWGLSSSEICGLIEKTGELEKYLTIENIQEWKLDSDDVCILVEKAGKLEEYLTTDKIKIIKGNKIQNMELVKKTGKVEEYLKTGILKQLGFNSFDIYLLIKEFEAKEKGWIEKNLTKDNVEKFGLNSEDIYSLIIKTGKVGKYLKNEDLKKWGVAPEQIFGLIKEMAKTEEIGEYLTIEKIKELKLGTDHVCELIGKTGKIEKYLTKENIKELKLQPEHICEIIEKSGKIEEFLTTEKIEECGLSSNYICKLIKSSGKTEKYLQAEEIRRLQLNGEQIADLMNERVFGFADYINNEIEKGTYNVEKIKLTLECMNILRKSNSSELQKICLPIALQICNFPEEERENVQLEIKNIFEANNLPNFVKNYLVFGYMHPVLLGENQNIMRDSSNLEHIPSLQGISPKQKGKIIFTDLLKINIESNNRNLREYITKIEKGNKLFEEILQGNLNLDKEVPKEKKESLEQYCEILNSIYCQISGKKRTNSPNLQQNVNKLCSLFNIDEHGGIEELPNRIVKTFGKPLGITTLQQVKEKMNSIVEQTTEENKKNARIGITLEKGDLAKGIGNTSYIHSMFQNGIVAKDYLGGDADSDGTPGDTDVELITSVGKNFWETYKSLGTAPGYATGDASGRRMGKVIFIFGSNEFIKTRGENSNKDSVDKAQNEIEKTEYFDNNGKGGGNAYGIRTGIGSSRIKCIIAPSYVDKLRT